MQASTLLGHPRGLYTLFLTEMWERFSYYGMRALLVLYLTKHFLFEREAAYGLYGAYTTLAYITPVIGGVLADRYLGQRKAVLCGAIFLVLGHLGMAIEGEPVAPGSTPGTGTLNIFYLSLALIITGVGFLKANISTIVGALYRKTDTRRDSAFTIFYVGINLGAALGALLAGYLGETFGWAYGFGAAGIGMLLGLLIFIFGKPTLLGAGEPPNPVELRLPVVAGLSREWIIYLDSIAAVFVIWLLIRDDGTVGRLLLVAGIVTVMYVLYRSFRELDRQQFQRVLVCLALMSTNVLFWSLFNQAGSSLNIYTDEHVDRVILGWDVPASMFQSVNATFIVLLGPLFAATWAWLGKRGLEPSAPVKFSLALMLLGLGFLVLVLGARSSSGLTPVLFVFLIYLLHTTAELCLSPVGLSAITRLSVSSMVGLMMGTWFLTLGGGQFVAAQIAKLTAGDGADKGDPSVALDVYSNVGWMAIGVGVALALISPILKRGMHLQTLRDDAGPRPQPSVNGERPGGFVHAPGHLPAGRPRDR